MKVTLKKYFNFLKQNDDAKQRKLAGKNVLRCNEYMFRNQLYCDVIFKVGTTEKKVKAHKYVLASRSSVFATMLNGSFSDASDVIVVPDIEAEAFDILLK